MTKKDIFKSRKNSLLSEKLYPVAESIDFQNDAQFSKNFDELIGRMRGHVYQNRIKTPQYFLKEENYLKELNALILDRIGFNFIFDPSEESDMNAAVITLIRTNPSILNNEGVYSPEEYEHAWGAPARAIMENIRYLQDKPGYLDFKKAKASGSFSEVICPMFIDFVSLFNNKKGWTDRQIVAVMLHEIGHVWTQLETSMKLTRVNQIIANLTKAIRNGQQDKKKIVLKELGAELNLTEKEIDDLDNTNTSSILSFKLFQKTLSYIDSEVKVDFNNNISSEQLADNFAVRFGYGKDLATALTFNEIDSFPYKNFEILLGNIYEIVGLITGIIVGLAIPYILAYTLFYALLTVLVHRYGAFPPTYDDLDTRISKIRQQLIEMIKNKNLSKERIEVAIQELDLLKEMVKKTKLNMHWVTKLSIYLLPGSRKKFDEVELQKTLEDLTHNELFITAAKYKNLT